MDMTQTTLAIIGLTVSIAGCLTWAVQKLVGYLIAESKRAREYVETLVSQNQKNTENFLAAVNHQQTLNRDMQSKTNTALEALTGSLTVQNEVNKKLVELITSKKI